jgi:hypothetical protein
MSWKAIRALQSAGLGMLWIGLFVFMWFTYGCASAPKTARISAPPDTTGVLAIMGKYSIAHACPVSENLALTAAHVIDPRPFDKETPLHGSRWSAAGEEGLIDSDAVLRESDLGFISSLKPFPAFYQHAEEAPEVGETLWLVGYNWSGAKEAFAEKIIRVEVVRLVAGHLIFNRAGQPGSSGSCVLNSRGELVGINVAGMGVGYKEEVGIAVSVWGAWWPTPKEAN